MYVANIIALITLLYIIHIFHIVKNLSPCSFANKLAGKGTTMKVSFDLITATVIEAAKAESASLAIDRHLLDSSALITLILPSFDIF